MDRQTNKAFLRQVSRSKCVFVCVHNIYLYTHIKDKTEVKSLSGMGIMVDNGVLKELRR